MIHSEFCQKWTSAEAKHIRRLFFKLARNPKKTKELKKLSKFCIPKPKKKIAYHQCNVPFYVEDGAFKRTKEDRELAIEKLTQLYEGTIPRGHEERRGEPWCPVPDNLAIGAEAILSIIAYGPNLQYDSNLSKRVRQSLESKPRVRVS